MYVHSGRAFVFATRHLYSPPFFFHTYPRQSLSPRLSFIFSHLPSLTPPAQGKADLQITTPSMLSTSHAPMYWYMISHAKTHAHSEACIAMLAVPVSTLSCFDLYLNSSCLLRPARKLKSVSLNCVTHNKKCNYKP